MSASFTAIATTDLAAVTGGASSRAATDERIMDKLQSITVAIQDAANQQAAGQQNNPMSAMMPIVAMKMMRRQ